MGGGAEYYKLLITVNTRRSKEFRSPHKEQISEQKMLLALLSLRKFQETEALRARNGAEPTSAFSVISQGAGLPCGSPLPRLLVKALPAAFSRELCRTELLPVGDFPPQGPLLSWGLGPCLGQHPVTKSTWQNPLSAGGSLPAYSPTPRCGLLAGLCDPTYL